MQFKEGKSYVITGDLFDVIPKGMQFVYSELNGKYCLVVTEEHAYVCEIAKLAENCEEADQPTTYDYKEVIINDRKQWFNTKIKQLEKLCDE